MALAGALLCMGNHAAAGQTCADPRVSVQGELDPRWLAPVVDLCEALRALPDLDPSAKLRVVPEGADIVVEVRLADGRTALRRVTSPDELRMTVEALMTVPPAPPTTEPPASSAPPVPAPTAAQERQLPSASEREPRAAAVSFEWAALASGRVAGSPTYLSLGPTGHFSLRAGDWLLALSARWDAYQTLSGPAERSFEMDTVAAGFGVARRIVNRPGVRLDLGPSLLLVNEAQSLEGANGEQAGSVADLRLGAVTRFWLGGSTLRFVAQLDAEVSPTRLRREIHVDPALPALPTWSAGLGMGVGWAAP